MYYFKLYIIDLNLIQGEKKISFFRGPMVYKIPSSNLQPAHWVMRMPMVVFINPMVKLGLDFDNLSYKRLTRSENTRKIR